MLKSLVLLLVLSTPSMAGEFDLPLKAKQIIYGEIADLVFFEDEGHIRAPSQLEDFTFIQTDEFEFSVTGDSFSDWDDKVIHYDCTVDVLTRGMIQSAKDIDVSCDLTGENWPNDSRN